MFAINWNSAENNNYHRFKQGSTVINPHLNLSQITIQVIRIFEATKKIDDYSSYKNHHQIFTMTFLRKQHVQQDDNMSYYLWPDKLFNHWFSILRPCFFCKSNIISSNRIKKTMSIRLIWKKKKWRFESFDDQQNFDLVFFFILLPNIIIVTGQHWYWYDQHRVNIVWHLNFSFLVAKKKKYSSSTIRKDDFFGRKQPLIRSHFLTTEFRNKNVKKS